MLMPSMFHQVLCSPPLWNVFVFIPPNRLPLSDLFNCNAMRESVHRSLHRTYSDSLEMPGQNFSMSSKILVNQNS